MWSLRIRSHVSLFAVFVGLLLALPRVLAAPSSQDVVWPDATTTSPERLAQRQTFLEARDALSRRQMTRYETLLEQLEGYPLAPYLTYRELTRNLQKASPEAVGDFLEAESGSYLAHQLQRQWLHSLARQKRWDQYLSDYPGALGDTELACHALHARLTRGDKSALDEVEPLWNVARSQPEACDPVFDRWMAEGRLTPAITWERHTKAIKGRAYGLANYLARQMPDSWQGKARLMREVNRNPKALAQTARFREQSEAMQDIISHGIQRLARRDALQALALWRGYDAQQLFSHAERLATQETIAQRLIFQGHREQADQLLATVPALGNTDLVESLIRDALEQLDWERAYTWLNQLPAEAQDSERWRYWRARMIEELALENTGPEPRDLYAAVAATRSFYGFLSADKLGFEYRLLDQPAPVSDAVLADMEQHPALQRAYEWLMIGDTVAASREWYYTVPGLEHERIMAAGKLAQRWGWHRKGIQAMISARFWDDLQMRFPLAYQEHVQAAARDTAIHPHLLFAIARQESAFMPHARSPAGAMGLMQLMPATAQQTARRAGVPYRRADLLSPEKNIALGSRYLNELLTEFGGNRILATAAYNAGPYRVKQWLREKTHKLPYDVWIETIPFRETRGYVQNVLSYSVIYGYRMGEKSPFITAEEASAPF
ncbi:transglycosylase SLT domain-containing protein [Marinimicrobium sp. UBA4209]|jgi:soluble lytic murein transglycosylase|uniref:transglycosylase SLT domain-containing protein n=1 Tax=Marinimicrobium sp. UBA4209 TaxID=1946810 RepID=UPI00257AB58B|nr:transglycosylase SLT domain-containing protein [Marinimicrobium sp. UBA4209]